MKNETGMEMTSASLFLLSPRDQTGLRDTLSALGWTCISAQRPGNAASRFLASEARLAIVDVRGCSDGAARIALLGSSVESIGGALIAIIDRAEGSDNKALFSAGATHILCAPFAEAELSLVIDTACESVRRLTGDDISGGVRLDVRATATKTEVDALTGLANRRMAVDWLSKALDQCNNPPTCLLIGISQYESINAAYGQAAGDSILARVARRIVRSGEEILGRDDLVARIAGTEFLIGLRPDTDCNESNAERALLLARQIVARVGLPFAAGDQHIRVIVRCGIAEGMNADDPSRLLRRTAAALADARRSGTGDISLRSADHRGRGLDLDRLDADLRLALDKGEIGVVFQPQYDVQIGKIIGVEALARWNHAQFGQLGAAMLFDAAERSDYLLPLSRHIQREALHQAGRWPSNLRDVRLSINVTAVDLAQLDFVSHFLDMVASSRFPPERLTVEITESGLIENIEAADELLAQLRVRGMRIAMDDFGTGYSSLSYLKGLHLDYLKIDSGLTRDIAGAPRDRVIVRSIIAMAKALSLSVIAEGVENEAQLALLKREGCDVYQGFLRSPAITSDALEKLVAAEKS
jgi:diguanylate cyclase (GGDEF)-like protein